jgi:two-component system, OmpR family, phosphate regulon sensor histidine kinase PhoR
MLRVLLALLVVGASAAIAAYSPGLGAGSALIGGAIAVSIAVFARPRGIQVRERARVPLQPSSESAVIAAISEPVLLVVDGRVQIANAAAHALLGAHIVGEDVRLAIRHPAAAERLGLGGTDGATELVGLSGRDQRLQMEVATIAPGRRIVHLIDRTTRYAAERARVDFVANSSHELRTPLAAIIGFIETLDDDNAGSDTEVRARFLSVMMKEARRMQRLIDDLISLSRIEAEKYNLPETAVALGPLIEEVAGELRDTEGKARADLVLEVDRNLPSVVGDRSQLSQVIHNLAGNAFKYGRAGAPVTITLRRESANLICLQVADRGDGIASEHIPRLTERFYRVDPGRSRSLGGTGLGLAIVKHIVERHRGRLDIASQAGVGTTVSVLLPTVAPAVVTEMSPN